MSTVDLAHPSPRTGGSTADSRKDEPPAGGPSTYKPELDGLRFMAFLLVFVHHVPTPVNSATWSRLALRGWIGVDLFLCLSAFLLTQLLWKEHCLRGSIGIGHFYIRRALRIWPLYYAFIIVALLGSSPAQWGANQWTRWVGLATFTDNILTYLLSYNGLVASAHLWTISLEEQVYLVLPWMLRWLFTLSNGAKALVLAVLWAIATLLKALFIGYQVRHPSIWVLPFTHVDSILGGMALGLGLFDRLPAWVTPPKLATLGVLIMAATLRLPNVSEIHWKLIITYAAVGLGVTAIVHSVTGQPWLATRVLRHRWLAYLGKISYGLYVFHVIGISTGRALAEWMVARGAPVQLGHATLVLSLALTIAVSAASYELLEKPFLRLKERFSWIHSRPA